mmetsp:Transcript_46307/g.122949  ORF Transcript_46307/g.122949 Transcript_46307/m.122949 type:complete len:337 (+) Transcript_46307:449-1459(+)
MRTRKASMWAATFCGESPSPRCERIGPGGCRCRNTGAVLGRSNPRLFAHAKYSSASCRSTGIKRSPSITVSFGIARMRPYLSEGPTHGFPAKSTSLRRCSPDRVNNTESQSSRLLEKREMHRSCCKSSPFNETMRLLAACNTSRPSQLNTGCKSSMQLWFTFSSTSEGSSESGPIQASALCDSDSTRNLTNSPKSRPIVRKPRLRRTSCDTSDNDWHSVAARTRAAESSDGKHSEVPVGSACVPTTFWFCCGVRSPVSTQDVCSCAERFSECDLRRLELRVSRGDPSEGGRGRVFTTELLERTLLSKVLPRMVLSMVVAGARGSDTLAPLSLIDLG